MNNTTLTSKFNNSGVVAANTVATVAFKDAAGNPSLAKRVNMRVYTAALGHNAPIHIDDDPGYETLTDPTGSQFFLFNGESFLTMENGPMGTIKLFNSHLTIDINVYIKAKSDVDISGTTIT